MIFPGTAVSFRGEYEKNHDQSKFHGVAKFVEEAKITQIPQQRTCKSRETGKPLPMKEICVRENLRRPLPPREIASLAKGL